MPRRALPSSSKAGLPPPVPSGVSQCDEHRRAAAGDAGQRLLRDGKEPGNDVSAWWEAARRFLDDPALWGIGFDNYVEVVLPAAKQNREAHR